MKTTLQISLGFIFGLLCFVGGYQYFNHTQPKQEGNSLEKTISYLKENTNKELFECPDGVYFDHGADILDGKEYGYIGVTCDNGENNNHKSSYFNLIQ